MCFPMIVIDVAFNTFNELQTSIGWLEINMLVLQRFPESLDPGNIRGSSLSIQRHLNLIVFEVVDPCRASIW